MVSGRLLLVRAQYSINIIRTDLCVVLVVVVNEVEVVLRVVVVVLNVYLYMLFWNLVSQPSRCCVISRTLVIRAPIAPGLSAATAQRAGQYKNQYENFHFSDCGKLWSVCSPLYTCEWKAATRIGVFIQNAFRYRCPQLNTQPLLFNVSSFVSQRIQTKRSSNFWSKIFDQNLIRLHVGQICDSLRNGMANTVWRRYALQFKPAQRWCTRTTHNRGS